jgi:hypothetical protein
LEPPLATAATLADSEEQLPSPPVEEVEALEVLPLAELAVEQTEVQEQQKTPVNSTPANSGLILASTSRLS